MTTLSQFHCARGEGKSKEIWQHGKTSSTLPNGIKGGEEGGEVNFFWIRHNFLFFIWIWRNAPKKQCQNRKPRNYFPLVLHNTLIPAARSVRQLKGRGRPWALVWQSAIAYGFRPVSLSLFSPFPFCWAENTCTHTETPKGESWERFTLSLKINDTSNDADGCNQKFKRQAASLSLSPFFSAAIAKESCNSVRCERPGLCVSLSYHHLICSSPISYHKS